MSEGLTQASFARPAFNPPVPADAAAITCLKDLTDESILNACRRHPDWADVEDGNNLIVFLRILLMVCRQQGSGVQYDHGIDTNLRKLVGFRQHPNSDSAEFGRLICELYDAQWEIGGQFPFGINCAEEVIDDGASNGMTLLQYFDPTLNDANAVANQTDIEGAYKIYTLASLMCMNAKCNKALMEFLNQQQALKPVGKTVYPNKMAVAINFINNQEERSRRANTNNGRDTNKSGGDADGDEDAEVKTTNVVEDNEESQTSDNSEAGVRKENDGKSDAAGNATVTTAYAAPAGDEWHRSEDVKEEFDWNADGTVSYTNACEDKTPEAENYMDEGNEPQPENYMDEGSEPQPEQQTDIQPPENYMDGDSEPHPEQ